MSDYVTVPNVNGQWLQNGIDIFYTNVGIWKVGYNSSTDYTIRCGVYFENGNYGFMFVTDSIVSGVSIRLISPIGTTSASSDSFTLPYTIINYTPVVITTPLFAVTVYSNATECYNAIKFPDTPGIDSGVVVTAIASQLPPSLSGVIVYGTARLLDPNEQAGTSTSGGGNGTFNDSSDPVPIPELPSISGANSGLVTLFRPTISQLHSLGSYLWTNLTDFIENLNKLFMNPMDYLISLNILPCVPDVGSERAIKIGSVTTTINMSPVLSQWYEFNCGTIQISEYWGSALDYAPNTKISLFLPFIGSVSLNTDEVMGKRLGVVYRIDLLSGQCLAMVTVSGLVDQTDSVYYQYTGECGVSIPMTGADWSRIYSAAIGAVGTAITGGVAAGAAGVAAGNATRALGINAVGQSVQAGKAFAEINRTSAGIRGVQQMRLDMEEASRIALNAARDASLAPEQVAHGVSASRMANTVNNTIQQVISGKGFVSHTGTVSASAGMLGVKTPYVLIEYPNQSLANNYKHFVGYPSNMYARLGDLSGYTECEQVIPNGLVNQTDMEMAEILEALKGGVYL